MRAARAREAAFIDSGAWIALAIRRDPLHARAVETWRQIVSERVALYSSVPVVIETFTFLDRNTSRDVALSWRDSLDGIADLRILDCTASDLRDAWVWFERPDLHKLSAVDAASFVLMTKNRIRQAFAFDHHFAAAGFHLLG